MRHLLAAVLLVLGSSEAFAGDEIRTPSKSSICSIRWPNDGIPVPDLVSAFIVTECQEYAGKTDEDLDDCVAGERAGYRATVMMLSDSETGERAAERYRACRAGLGMHGARFHRRRAECIGSSFQYVWRFESTRRASMPQEDWPFRTAADDGGSTILDDDHHVPFGEKNARDERGSQHTGLGADQLHRASFSGRL